MGAEGGSGGAGLPEWRSILTQTAERARRNKQTRRRLPGGGRLFMDGRTPFVAVYRPPGDRSDPGTPQFAASLRSYVLLPKELHAGEDAIPGRLARLIADDLGAALVIELWSSPKPAADPSAPPIVRIHLANIHGDLAADFAESLAGIPVIPEDEAPAGKDRAVVDLVSAAERTPSGFGPPEAAGGSDGRSGQPTRVQWAGVELPRTFLSNDGNGVLPERLALFRQSLSAALENVVCAWARRCTTMPATTTRHALGRQNLGRTARAIDGRLTDVAEAFDLLFAVSPVNGEALWREFEEAARMKSPRFRYRPLSVDPETLKRSLFQVPVERIEDPLVARLIREKQEELDLRITMLTTRGTPEFLLGSRQLFGQPDDELLELAHGILDVLPPDDIAGDGGAEAGRDGGAAPESSARRVRTAQFVDRARAELARYADMNPAFPQDVVVRDDISAGVLVSNGVVCVSSTLSLAPERTQALIHHEIGTHVVTYFNGTQQPFRLLASGLAHYGALQEGLAVLAEYLVGGLTRSRARTLAARVIAVDSCVEGADFVAAFERLTALGFSPRRAFRVLVRVYRGGGFTKDMQYLLGLRDLLTYLRTGGRVDTLFVGKVGLSHIDLVRQLELRGILEPPAVRPRYTVDEAVMRRLEDCRNRTVIDLVREAQP